MANRAQIHLQIRRLEGGLSRVTGLWYAWPVKKNMSRDRQVLWKTGIIWVLSKLYIFSDDYSREKSW